MGLSIETAVRRSARRRAVTTRALARGVAAGRDLALPLLALADDLPAPRSALALALIHPQLVTRVLLRAYFDEMVCWPRLGLSNEPGALLGLPFTSKILMTLEVTSGALSREDLLVELVLRRSWSATACGRLGVAAAACCGKRLLLIMIRPLNAGWGSGHRPPASPPRSPRSTLTDGRKII
jgi:hypothetical protein